MANRILDDQPWLAHYDEGVPHQLSYPTATVPQLLEDAARRFPGAACLLYAGQQLSYAQTSQLVNRLAAALAERGIKPGSRLGLLLPNLPSFVLAYMAILKLGCIVVAINPQYTSREIAQRLTDSELSILFALNDLVPTVKTAQAGTPLHTLIVMSLSLALAPTIIPSYTTVPGSTKVIPRPCAASSPYAAVIPLSLAINTPRRLNSGGLPSGSYPSITLE